MPTRTHEAAVAARLRERLPGVAVTASHEVSRNWREYERSNTAVLSAYVQPIMAGLSRQSRPSAHRRGHVRPALLHAVEWRPREVRGRRGRRRWRWSSWVRPAASPARSGSARRWARRDILYLDVGGTTAKCSLIRDGQPVLKSEYKLEWTRLLPGYPVQVPVVDIVEIGAGGGSIAHIGPAGELRVGPESAGADPGPACYGRGGDEADRDRRQAPHRRHRPRPLRRRADAPRQGARGEGLRAGRAASRHERDRRRRGRDPPRRGQHDQCAEAGHHPARPRPARPDHGGERRRRSDACRDAGPRARRQAHRDPAPCRPVLGLGDADRPATLRSPPDQLLDAHRRDAGDGARAVPPPGGRGVRLFRRWTAIRRWSSTARSRCATSARSTRSPTPFDPGAGLDALREAFHARHEQTYTFRLPDTDVELVTYHLGAELDTPRVDLPEIAAGGSVEAALIGDLEVWFGENGGEARASVYDRDRLPPGAVLDGPVLIEEPTATTMVLPGQRATVDRFGLVVIEEAR